MKYFLRNKTTKEETTISLKVYLPNRKELVYSTGLKISPQNWDDKNQKVRSKVEVATISGLATKSRTNFLRPMLHILNC